MAKLFSSNIGNSNLTTGKTSAEDTIAGDNSTGETLTVGSSTTGYVNDTGDLDWFAIDLVAGERYVFETSANGANNTDTILTLFNSSSTEITSNDDGGTGIYSQISYTATETGTHYLQVGGYHGFGNGVGNYTLSAAIAPPATSVLPTLDWNTQVPGTNNTSNNVINVYFADDGEIFDGQTSIGWGATEEDAAMEAFDHFSDYINVTFNVVNSAAASDMQMVQAASLGGTLGYFNPPGTANEGVGVFAADGAGWNAAGLAQGGYAFITLIHEIGHGLGLAHPHDNGGGSTIMDGVTSSQGDYGTYDLNQGIFTMMSYNDGWPAGPHGASPSNDYGWAGTAMALDVALLQDKYGENTTHESGNSTYSLSDTNAAGTFYASIWDTGGTDTISFSGSANANIDLREATLLEETNGGGYVSYVTGVHGGYTIANGAVIENATGGSGNDTLTGNDVANIIDGGAGNDVLNGGAGNDTFIGGQGTDVHNGGDGHDIVDYSSATIGTVSINLDTEVANGYAASGDTFEDIEEIIATDRKDFLAGDHDDNTFRGGDGNDTLTGRWGDDTIYGENGNDRIYGGVDDDVVYGDAGNDGMQGGDGNDFMYGGTGNDVLLAGAGIDHLYGGTGDDIMNGGTGNDIFYGDQGADVHRGSTGHDIVDYSDVSIGTVSINLDTGLANGYGASGDTFEDIEEIIATDRKDFLAGDYDDNTFRGGAGNDTLTGRWGDDTIYGDAGNDNLYGGVDDDVVYGGIGNDGMQGGDGHDEMYGGIGNDVLLAGAGIDFLDGGAGNDRLVGGSSSDTYYFADGFGNDIISGFEDGLDLLWIQADVDSSDFNITLNAAGNVVVDFGTADNIEFLNITDVSLITADDFTFLS